MSTKVNIKTTTASLIEINLLKARISQVNSHRKISRQHKFCHGKTHISSTRRIMVMEQINSQLMVVAASVQTHMTNRNQEVVLETSTFNQRCK